MRTNHCQDTGIAVGHVLALHVQEGNNIGTDNWIIFYTKFHLFFNTVPLNF